ncbi:general transcription factor II-I repeat domain-containing protein 2-like [Acipenser oxyrinchus oxyrinchus]|uniref:General transcription factor II-I repeat domain-containing protein 2-like n=1 Tax=Acipenser oxyrinchus oxyrinchus TaxID=40147 RepID=A0AAD8GLC0_ACIOX|nr:general transcription factor II-I repeat domain-containing protein 2-like [Acipenser oxyrinchus oxyrinchus]
MELIDLQCNSGLKDVFHEKKLVEFYYSLLPNDQFQNLRKFARRMCTVFGSTYICEQTFSLMKLNKSKLRSRLTDDYLHDVLWMSVSNFEPNFEKLVAEKQPQRSH